MISAAVQSMLFYLFAFVAILLALAVVNTRRLLRAAIFLMGVLLTSAALYILLNAEFLAGVQVLVYVGGIVVLIVFAVMLTRSADLQADKPSWKRQALAAVGSIGFLALTAGVFCTMKLPAAANEGPALDNTQAIGRTLLDQGGGGYVLPFEIISLLLLAAAIGGIVVARKTPPTAQPFTTGGDQPGEAEFHLPLSQREKARRP